MQQMNNSIYNPLHGPQLIVYDVNELCIKKGAVDRTTFHHQVIQKQLVLNLLVKHTEFKEAVEKTDDVLNRLFFITTST